jgi:(1->4)-alpha-D-glucan 1-alpha-D-glucosylmutase
MNATSTHDTKRSEDVRARISVLSEIPEEWELCLIRWRQWNREKKALVNGSRVPAANEEILLYQTMLGAWPLAEEELPSFQERLRAYILKAAREAKAHTRWIDPNEEYEHELLRFVEAILRPAADNLFLNDFLKFQERISYHGALNSLAQVLLKIGSPGVPDFYQGTELWDFSLVDPDNRRPVNFQKRTLFLKDLKKRAAKGLRPLAQQLLSGWQDGRLKLFLMHQALNFRRAHLDLFLHGDYLPLAISGPQEEMALALARRQGPEWALVIVPRLTTRNSYPGLPPLGERAWDETLLHLPPEAPAIWKNVLTADTLQTTRLDQAQALPLKDVLRHFPVALLAGASA